jgi:hypothetical protein
MLRAAGVHPDDLRWAEEQLFGLPEIARARLLTESSTLKTRCERNTYLRENSAPLRKIAQIAIRIKDYSAKNEIIRILNVGNQAAIEKLDDLLSTAKIENAIKWQGVSEDQVCKLARQFSRNTSELVLRRKIRRDAKQGVSYLNMSLGLIGKRGNKYATGFEVELRNQQKARWYKFGEDTVLIREGQSISMLDMMKEGSRRRFSELYTLIKGMENYAMNIGGVDWAFITLTAPPMFHSNPKKGIKSWNGSTPKDAHDWIKERWRKAGKILRKKGIFLGGLRVVEPHEDGCAHWHILVFDIRKNINTIEEVLRTNPEWKTSVGCAVMLNDGTASAASYVTKYVLSTIGTIEKLAGEQGSVDAWRGTWGIRAFQFFGMPKLDLWRQLRKMEICPGDALLADMWRAARQGDGQTFISLAGGLAVKGIFRPMDVRTVSGETTKTATFTNRETGEVTELKSKKWTKEKLDNNLINKNNTVAVIHNYPRKPKASTRDCVTEVNLDQSSPFWDANNSGLPRNYKKHIGKTEWFNGDELRKWEDFARKVGTPEAVIREMISLAEPS